MIPVPLPTISGSKRQLPGIAAACAYGAAGSARELWGEETQIAINEFSLATFSNIHLACKDWRWEVFAEIFHIFLGASSDLFSSHYFFESKQMAVSVPNNWKTINFGFRQDRSYLVYLLNTQLGAFQSQGFTASFWTWKTSLAYDFQPGWSLRWLLGLEAG